MQVASRFTIAVHIFACLDVFKDEVITSDFLAGSINVHPVVVRSILLYLKAAGLIHVSRGRGKGIKAARPFDQISFFDIYQAVRCVDDSGLFRFHEGPNPECPVGRHIHKALDGKLERIQQGLEDELRKWTVADVVRDTRTAIAEESVAL